MVKPIIQQQTKNEMELQKQRKIAQKQMKYCDDNNLAICPACNSGHVCLNIQSISSDLVNDFINAGYAHELPPQGASIYCHDCNTKADIYIPEFISADDDLI